MLVLAGVSAAGAARPGAALRQEARSLGSRTEQALLGLYALDTQLHAAQARLTSLEADAARLRAEQQALAQQVSATRRTLAVSQQQLGDNLALLYKQGDVNALAVMLGSESLDDALSRLDDLRSVADQSAEVVAATAGAQSRLATLRATLAARGAALESALAEARTTTARLAAARNERASFVAGLRRERRLKTAQIRALEAAAARVEKRSDKLQAAAAATTTSAAAPDPVAPEPAAAPASTPVAGPSGRTLTVSSTGYSLPGRTATGLPVGWGVVAVDPAVIPLGTRLTIPGYGEGVAADTGGAVRGATIDIWFPTLAQARAWGRRTVTIVLH